MSTPDDPRLDQTTFVFPTQGPTITIEFCDRCRWLHRATWVQTELLLTFSAPIIGSVTLIPRNSDETAGRFRVWLSSDSLEKPLLLWDRKIDGGFPELQPLKQRVRDQLQPGRSLGHSDKKKVDLVSST